MAVLKMATADYQDSLLNITTGSISASAKRTGTYSYRFVNAQYSIIYFPETNEGYARYALYFDDNLDGYAGPRIFMRHTGTTQIKIDFYPQLGYYNIYPADSYDDQVTGIAQGQWYVFEIYWKIDNTTGRLVIKQDGTNVYDFTGDTQNGTKTVISDIYLGTDGVSSTAEFYVDDIIIRDDDWPGRGGIYVFMANAGSTLEDWHASAGNPEDCVDDNPPSYTDYIYQDGTLPGSGHLVGLEDIATDPDAIKAVGVVASIKLDEAGTSNVMPIIQSGSTKSSGDSIGVSTSNQVLQGYWSQNPDTASDWTISDVNALEAGVEVTGG